ncbi:unnamed protein product [Pedinophyceae sp. YPF-701]|nr:unnamed protein product [Pedinophyceae sp. YPF-701]
MPPVKRIPSVPNKKKRHQKRRKDAGGKKAQREGRSFFGMIGIVTGIVAAGIMGFLYQQKQDRELEAEDRRILKRMLRTPLQWTDHGVCRMDCRHISEKEVIDTLRTGRINRRKSEMRSRPCPKYVVDARVGDAKRKNVQCVFSGCADVTRVVTVIDKDFDWPCGAC